MSSPTSPTSGLHSSMWQEKLQDHCRRTQLHPPVFNILSDRRGGRTAWSATVTIPGQRLVQARFWYDGQYVSNAKEDAAEVALQQLTGGGPGAGSGPSMAPRGATNGIMGGMGGGAQGRGWQGRMAV